MRRLSQSSPRPALSIGRLSRVTFRFTLEQRASYAALFEADKLDYLSILLHDLTPMGSEFTDPLKCIEHVAERLHAQSERMHEQHKEIRELEERLARRGRL